MKQHTLSLNNVEKSLLPDYTFFDRAIGFQHIYSDNWYSALEKDEFKKTLLETHKNMSTFEEKVGTFFKGFISFDNGLILIVNNMGTVSIVTASDDSNFGSAASIRFRELFPPTSYTTKDSDDLYVKFWYMDRGVSSRQRKLEMVKWDDISSNYTKPVGDNISKLINLTPEDINGKVLVWYGEAGTGKTYAIHALALAWRDWCKVEYVADPETFFANPAYMLQVFLSNEDGEVSSLNNVAPSVYYDEDEFIDIEEEKKEKWVLLVLEDSGELIHINASEKTGQSLSRLLNTVDGFIGQGLRVMVLITTNEQFDSLNKAIIRPGRSLSNIEFKALTKAESMEWMKANNSNGNFDDVAPASYRLSDLYAKKNDKNFKLKTLNAQVGLPHS